MSAAAAPTFSIFTQPTAQRHNSHSGNTTWVVCRSWMQLKAAYTIYTAHTAHTTHTTHAAHAAHTAHTTHASHTAHTTHTAHVAQWTELVRLTQLLSYERAYQCPQTSLFFLVAGAVSSHIVKCKTPRPKSLVGVGLSQFHITLFRTTLLKYQRED